MPFAAPMAFAALGLSLGVLALLVRRGLLSPRQFGLAAFIALFGATAGAALAGGLHV